MMKTKKKQNNEKWLSEKQLRRNSLLLYENYAVTEKELEECKRIIEKFRERSQSSSAQ